MPRLQGAAAVGPGQRSGSAVGLIGPRDVTATPQVHARAHVVNPDLAGPETDTVFVANSSGYTVDGFPTTASGNASPSYLLGNSASSPSGPIQGVFDASGDLWMINQGSSSITEYTKSQVAQGGSPRPATTLLSNGTNLDGPSGLAFDGAGDLWVSNYGNDTVVEFKPAQLAAGGAPRPATVVSSDATGSLADPSALLFIGTSLWVGNDQQSASSIVEYTANQLSTGGKPDPVTTVTDTGHIDDPTSLAVDTAGNLWVSSRTGSSGEVGAFTPAQRLLGGAIDPSVVLSSSAFSAPAGLSFDRSGNLWMSNEDGDTVIDFTRTQLATSGSPQPTVVLSPSGSGSSASLATPFGTAFDAAGNLWVENLGNSSVVSFPPSQLATSGDPVPAARLTPSIGLEGPGDVAFDPSGNLWVTNPNNSVNAVVSFTPAQIAAGASQPSLVVSLPGGTTVSGITFDSAGDLWVADDQSNAISEYRAASLVISGAPAPSVVLSTNGDTLDGPQTMDFDATGDLWVADAGNNHVVEYTATQLAVSGSPIPAVTLESNGTNLVSPVGLTFDKAGDLWVTNNFGDSVVEFTASQLGSSGGPTPAVMISANNGSLSGPIGLAFDASGNLWVANGGNNRVIAYSSSQLSASGAPTPAITVSGPATGLNRPAGIAVHAASQRTMMPGYWEVSADGGVSTFGPRASYGSLGGTALNAPVVGIAPTPLAGSVGGRGYWLVASDGGVFTFGDAGFYGSAGNIRLNEPVVGMAATPDGRGYWLVASDGGVFSYGDAGFYGSAGNIRLNEPVVGIASTPDGRGYWLVASDGGVFSYGDAGFYGSAGNIRLNEPVVGMAATPDGKGYWLVASDGGVFSYGDAGFYGSAGNLTLAKPVTGIASTPDGKGYWLVASDGGVFSYGDAGFYGSSGGTPVTSPIVGLAN